MTSIPVEHAAIEHLPLTKRAGRDSMLMTRAGNIRLACFDVDGTLTDGRLFFDSEGRELKAFHVHDGQGLVLLRQVGIEVALITARHSEVARRRAEELGVRAHIGVKDKLACVRELCAELGIGLEAVCFMGDDLPDLPEGYRSEIPPLLLAALCGCGPRAVAERVIQDPCRGG